MPHAGSKTTKENPRVRRWDMRCPPLLFSGPVVTFGLCKRLLQAHRKVRAKGVYEQLRRFFGYVLGSSGGSGPRTCGVPTPPNPPFSIGASAMLAGRSPHLVAHGGSSPTRREA